MPSPQISFRLSAYQLARGLKLIRAIEPEYTPTSISQLVKTIYIDYLSYTDLSKDDQIDDADIAEIHFLIKSKSKPMNLSDFQNATTAHNSLDAAHDSIATVVVEEVL